jgi:hypothetical protein
MKPEPMNDLRAAHAAFAEAERALLQQIEGLRAAVRDLERQLSEQALASAGSLAALQTQLDASERARSQLEQVARRSDRLVARLTRRLMSRVQAPEAPTQMPALAMNPPKPAGRKR